VGKGESEGKRRSPVVVRGGESFVVTRNGAPVGQLIPMQRRRFVAARAAIAACAGAPSIDPKRFRADIDGSIDQEVVPRA
jgi:antitoxin (DNA-binding transcriptional repressor) of toxin-antitoxin stability system